MGRQRAGECSRCGDGCSNCFLSAQSALWPNSSLGSVNAASTLSNARQQFSWQREASTHSSMWAREVVARLRRLTELLPAVLAHDGPLDLLLEREGLDLVLQPPPPPLEARGSGES